MPNQHPVPLLLARHGETEDNAGGLILGHRDPPLSTTGHEQAAELASRARAAHVAALWTSPLRRARETADAIAASLGVRPTVLPDLIESDRGTWEGRPFQELVDTAPDLFEAFEAADADFVFPGGESISAQVGRTRRALNRVAAGPQPSLVVAHAGTIRAALLAIGRAAPHERAIPHGELIAVPWTAAAGAGES